MKPCKGKKCDSWFSTYSKAFKGMDCYKPNAGHCTRNIHDQCSEKFEYYIPKMKLYIFIRNFWWGIVEAWNDERLWE